MTPDDAPGGARGGAQAVTAGLCWLGVGAFLAWAITFFLDRLHIQPSGGTRQTVCVAGLALASLVLCAWALHSPRLLRGLRARARSSRPARSNRDDDALALRRHKDEADAPSRPGAAGAREAASLAHRAIDDLDAARQTTPLPEVLLVRAGERGVELLLAERIEVAPAGFELLDSGHSLRHAADGEASSGLVESDGEGRGAGLVELGSDGDGTYFAPGGTLVVGTDRPGALGDPGALVVVPEPPLVVVEPFGLRLWPPLNDGPEPPLERPGPAGLASPESGAEPLPESAREPCLLRPGRIEVRILREEPDLVGELLVAPSAPAVELVAYLATHEQRATTARLRDCLGTARSLTSRSSKTVWSAASDARRALGEGLLPASSGTQPYELSDEVSSDWGRFQALSAMARESEDTVLARRALAEACSLVKGVPGLSSRRFAWLDTEGLLAAMTSAITEAAQRLAGLELEALEAGDGSAATARLALGTWRLLSPGAPALAEAEERFELVRR